MLWMSPSEYISASANNFNFGNLVWKPTPLEPQLMYLGVDYSTGEYTAFGKRSSLFGDKIEPHLFPFVLGSRTRMNCIIKSHNYIKSYAYCNVSYVRELWAYDKRYSQNCWACLFG